MEIPSDLCLHECLRVLENKKSPSHPSNAVRVDRQLLDLCKLQQAFVLSSMATPREDRLLFLETAPPHLSAKETGSFKDVSPGAFSPGLSCRCTFQEGGRQVGGLLMGSKYFLKHRKQGDGCCSPHAVHAPAARHLLSWRPVLS